MKRLIDDPEMARDLRAEMQRYAAEQAQVDLKRVYAGLKASLPLAAAPAVAPRGRFSGSTWSSLSGTTKLLIVAAIGGTSALTFTALRGGEQAAHVQSVNSAPPLQPIAAQPAGSEHAPTGVTTATGAAQPAEAPRGLTAPESMTSASGGGWRQAAAPGPTRTGSASRREIAQLARIKALLEQDPAAARRLIRAAQREFPAGLLVEEREGLDVIALFALAQNERARAGAERFIARYPQSPLRPKLERLIADARE
jgi:hypothetical protein